MKRSVVVLEVAESKRLIGKAVAALPEVATAYKKGRLVIAGGTTNAFVAEELTGQELDKAGYTAGVIADGKLCVTALDKRIQPLIFEKGAPSQRSLEEVLTDFGPEDCFIKGANALDLAGNIGILASHPEGGTIGAAWAKVIARGSKFIAPVGLEKLIPSVPMAAKLTGQKNWEDAWGMAVSLYPVMGARVVTELEAFEILTGTRATMIAGGGVGGSEGAVTLALEGNLKEAWELVREIKGEAALGVYPQKCTECKDEVCQARER